MGRRRRVKQRKHQSRCSSEYGINASHESIELHRWCHGLAWTPYTKFRLSFFPSTGRGLQAKLPIEGNSLLLRVPSHLVITRTLLQKQSLEAHEALTQFLMEESTFGRASGWFPYVQSLPKSYDVPFFITQETAVQCLPSFWREPVMKQRHRFKNRGELYAWAYFTVNTRAVYHSDGGMALIPFLDMFNHSPHVSVSAKETPDGAYNLYSGPEGVAKYDQVFINYGPHGNIKLFLEYGFWVPRNPHDSIPICLSDLLHVVGSSSTQKKRIDFLQKYNLDQNMCLAISETAVPSWNVYACLDILRCKGTPPSTLEGSSIYRDNLEEDNRDLVGFLLTNKLEELRTSANALKNNFSFIRSCCMASDLLFTYVCAIEAALSSSLFIE